MWRERCFHRWERDRRCHPSQRFPPKSPGRLTGTPRTGRFRDQQDPGSVLNSRWFSHRQAQGRGEPLPLEGRAPGSRFPLRPHSERGRLGSAPALSRVKLRPHTALQAQAKGPGPWRATHGPDRCDKGDPFSGQSRPGISGGCETKPTFCHCRLKSRVEVPKDALSGCGPGPSRLPSPDSGC